MLASSLAPEKLSPAQRVTRAIEAALQRGVRPWVKPWSDTVAAGPMVLPRRANGIAYRGINVVALFNFMNRYVHGHGLALADAVLSERGKLLQSGGYDRLIPMLED